VRILTSYFADETTSIFLSVRIPRSKTHIFDITLVDFFAFLEIINAMTEVLRDLAVNAAKIAADKRFPRSKGRWSKEREIRPINE
jgi:hypothetical protein